MLSTMLAGVLHIECIRAFWVLGTQETMSHRFAGVLILSESAVQFLGAGLFCEAPENF